MFAEVELERDKQKLPMTLKVSLSYNAICVTEISSMQLNNLATPDKPNLQNADTTTEAGQTGREATKGTQLHGASSGNLNECLQSRLAINH